MAEEYQQGTTAEKASKILNDYCEFAYLMGSADSDRFHSESDIDLAIYPKPGIDDLNLAQLKSKLEEEFSRDVDLVSLLGVDLIFGRQVIETGRIIFIHNPEIHLRWLADQLSRYPDFKFSRAIIETNLLTRKKYV